MSIYDSQKGGNVNFLRYCLNCIYDENVPGICFDVNGVCNYCTQVEQLKLQYGTGEATGEDRMKKIVAQVKRRGSRQKYDCVVGVSGGTDSSYMIHLLLQWGLRPLAVHYDNTWNSAIATLNIYKVLNHFNVDLYTHVVSNVEIDDIFRSFFVAGVPELEASTDLGYAYVLRKVASQYRIKYIFEGHSFIEEGITPLRNNYFDGRYIREIHRRYGTINLRTYPLMTLTKFLKSSIFSGVKFIRPFWYIAYTKDEAREFLQQTCGWEYYGGHHLENRMTAFYHSVYLPQKFAADLRNNTLAAQVRNGYMQRDVAIKNYLRGPTEERELVEYFKRRLGIVDSEYEMILKTPGKNWTEFPTYKRHFELLKPLFFLLAKFNRVPMSFYIKYCRKKEVRA
jgi:N-acetyl sugar amidotransferase